MGWWWPTGAEDVGSVAQGLIRQAKEARAQAVLEQ